MLISLILTDSSQAKFVLCTLKAGPVSGFQTPHPKFTLTSNGDDMGKKNTYPLEMGMVGYLGKLIYQLEIQWLVENYLSIGYGSGWAGWQNGNDNLDLGVPSVGITIPSSFAWLLKFWDKKLQIWSVNWEPLQNPAPWRGTEKIRAHTRDAS